MIKQKGTSQANDGISQFVLQCKESYFLTGIHSNHENKFEDRQFKFKCSKFRCTDWNPGNCKRSDYLNDYGGEIDYEAANGYFFTGMESKFNDKEK